MFLLNVYLIIS